MTAGLGRARELLAKADDQATAEKVPGMAAHAEALAAVELAGATQLSALVALTESTAFTEGFVPAERRVITGRIRVMLGFSERVDRSG